MLALIFAAVMAADSLKLPPVPREFRGVWVATVGNIDWPSSPGLPVPQQQEELLAILDRAQSLHLNAVIFQVRPAGDAFYESELEPWSEYLTGKQGLAPSPKWDPLAFAVREAHARGLELHAWFNPYRARMSAYSTGMSPLHIARRYPSLAHPYGKLLWMDPGDDRVREHVVSVVLDVVKRYDIDGVHIDDYFYPYPEHDRLGRLVQFEDSPTYERYRKNGGTLERDDWRRENVDKLIESLYKGIHATKAWVKFGISPFGIYRPGNPAGVEGIDTFVELFADAKKWLNNGWADYFSPQLYWPVNSPAQNFRVLLRWWDDQNAFGRHMWPGLFTSRVGTRPDWPASEVISQITATRADKLATGHVHYSMAPLMANRVKIDDALTRAYDGPALIPESTWLQGETPRAPRARYTIGPSRVQACFGDTTLIAPRWWVLYVKRDTVWTARVLPGAVRSMALGALAKTDSVALSAVDRTGRQGPVTVAQRVARC